MGLGRNTSRQRPFFSPVLLGLGPQLLGGRRKGGIESLGGVLLESGQRVGVDVEGDMDGGMAQPFAIGLGVDAGLQEMGGARVAKVVEPNAG